MPENNKAHTATARRIAKRFQTTYNDGDGIDIATEAMLIEVETSATIEEGVQRLKNLAGKVFVAVTNKEAIAEAQRLTAGTKVGVMDPYGQIIKDSSAE